MNISKTTISAIQQIAILAWAGMDTQRPLFTPALRAEVDRVVNILELPPLATGEFEDCCTFVRQQKWVDPTRFPHGVGRVKLAKIEDILRGEDDPEEFAKNFTTFVQVVAGANRMRELCR